MSSDIRNYLQIMLLVAYFLINAAVFNTFHKKNFRNAMGERGFKTRKNKSGEILRFLPKNLSLR